MSDEFLSNNSFREAVWKLLGLNCACSAHSNKICFTVSGQRHEPHSGRGSPFNRWLCVRCVCPILRRHSTTSSFLLFLLKWGLSPSLGMTAWSLFAMQPSQASCQDRVMCLFMPIRASVCGIFRGEISSCRALAAATSAFSFPGIPIWHGIQHSLIVFPSESKRLYSVTASSTIGCWMFILRSDCRTDLESVNITNMAFAVSPMYSKANCMAFSSAVKIEHPSGRRF